MPTWGGPTPRANSSTCNPLPLSIDWIEYYWRFKRPEDREHLHEGLRLADVPEIATRLPRPPED